MILYKYFHPRHLLQTLEQRLLRFSQPGVLNDPFEMRPYYVGEEAWEQLRKWLIGHAWKLLGTDPDVFGDLHHADNAQLAMALDFYNNRMFGILSLSEKNDDLLMWSHYADGHRGFVLGFDATHAFFNWLGLPGDQVYKVARVSYSEERPRIASSTLIDVRPLFLVKSRSWEYEREWRFISGLHNADVKRKMCPYPLHLFRYPPESLREVVVGCRTNVAFNDQVRGIISAQPELSHVIVSSAQESADSFSVRLRT